MRRTGRYRRTNKERYKTVWHRAFGSGGAVLFRARGVEGFLSFCAGHGFPLSGLWDDEGCTLSA